MQDPGQDDESVLRGASSSTEAEGEAGESPSSSGEAGEGGGQQHITPEQSAVYRSAARQLLAPTAMLTITIMPESEGGNTSMWHSPHQRLWYNCADACRPDQVQRALLASGARKLAGVAGMLRTIQFMERYRWVQGCLSSCHA
jgi:hypothetical protein